MSIRVYRKFVDIPFVFIVEIDTGIVLHEFKHVRSADLHRENGMGSLGRCRFSELQSRGTLDSKSLVATNKDAKRWRMRVSHG